MAQPLRVGWERWKRRAGRAGGRQRAEAGGVRPQPEGWGMIEAHDGSAFEGGVGAVEATRGAGREDGRGRTADRGVPTPA